MESKIALSVIIPVTESSRHDDITKLYQEYKCGLDDFSMHYEIIYILDGDFPEIEQELMKLKENEARFKIVKLAKWFGEATAITAGFEYCQGDLILTLPAYTQIEPRQIKKLLAQKRCASHVWIK